MTENLIFFFFDQKLQFTYPYTSKHEISTFFFFFCGSFLLSWIRIRIPNPDPDPLTWLNPDPVRIRIRNTDGTYDII